MPGGRKAKWEELKIAQRYADLTEPFFNTLIKMLNSDDKADNKWAVEQIGKGFVKMIPQQITGEGGEAIKILISPDIINKYEANASSSGNSEGQA